MRWELLGVLVLTALAARAAFAIFAAKGHDAPYDIRWGHALSIYPWDGIVFGLGALFGAFLLVRAALEWAGPLLVKSRKVRAAIKKRSPD